MLSDREVIERARLWLAQDQMSIYANHNVSGSYRQIKPLVIALLNILEDQLTRQQEDSQMYGPAVDLPYFAHKALALLRQEVGGE